jgi:hypothetical protein
MAFVVVEHGNADDIGKLFTIVQKSTLIGRIAPDNNPHIILRDDYVSRQHAEICYIQGCYMLRDMGSVNGTEIDGQRLEPDKQYPLMNNSRIGLGIVLGESRVVLRFKESHATVRAPLDETEGGDLSARLKIDEKRKDVWIDNEVITLSKNEYALILLLYHKAGEICSKDEVISAIWPGVNDPGVISDATIDQLIYRLRKKIEPDPAHPIYVVSKKGFGCMLIK